MATIDLGICVSREIFGCCSISNLKLFLLNSLKLVSTNYQPYFESAYFYNSETDQGAEIYSIDKGIEQMLAEDTYNKFSFCIAGEHCFASIGFWQSGITVNVNLDYNSIQKISASDTPETALQYLRENMYALFQTLPYQFAFADFDSEIEYSYNQLLDKIKNGDYPYTLLLIHRNGKLAEYRSGYNLLGI